MDVILQLIVTDWYTLSVNIGTDNGNSCLTVHYLGIGRGQ